MSELSFTEELVESEKYQLLDYLFNYATNIISLLSNDVKELIYKYGVNNTDDETLRGIIENAYVRSYFNYSIPGSNVATILLNIDEIETETENIPENELDSFFVNGAYSYYYIGYGFTVELSIVTIITELRGIARNRGKV